MRPEAGWYPDPSSPHELRWWNGAAWTSETRSAQGAVRVPQPEAEPVRAPSGAVPPVEMAKRQAGPQVGPEAGPQVGTEAGPQVGTEAGPQVGTEVGLGARVVAQGQAGATVDTRPSPYPATAAAPLAGQRPLAGVWLRLPARFLDFVLVSIVSALVAIPWADGYLAAFDRYVQSALAGTADWQGLLRDPDYQGFSLILTATFFAVALLYEGVLLKTRGASLGKMALGLRVTAIDGGGLSWLQAMGRVVARIAPTWIFALFWTVLDSCWCLWDPRRQCLHDKLVRTVVVSTRR